MNTLEKVLIIDDDTNLLAGLKRQLRKRFEVTTAQDGETGIRLADREGPFSVVVCDMRMPGMDGLEVLSALAKRAPDMQRIMLTGNADQQTAVDAINDGRILRFYNKPCPTDRLAEGIEAGIAQFHLIRESQKLSTLGELAGGVAHDFNNLLMIIGGYSAMAYGNASDAASVRDALAKVSTATEQAAGLTTQLLSFSRRQIMRNQKLLVYKVMNELKVMLRPLLGETIELVFEVACDEGCVETDHHQLTQVLINLAINARDAMPDGGRLELGVEVIEIKQGDPITRRHTDVAAGKYVRFSVQDNGTGMDRETVSRIFEPFFTTKEQGKGTGLGLSMAYGFARQSGGFLDVESEPGKGTAFELYLPLVEKSTISTAELGEDAPGAKGEVILLAEDDDDLRKLAQIILEALGYTVLAAANGFEAMEIEVDYEGTIDLLLSDVVMPALGGFELAHAMMETRPETKILLMSGYPSRGQIKRSHSLEGVPVLAKPMSSSALAHNVRKALDGALSSMEAPLIASGFGD